MHCPSCQREVLGWHFYCPHCRFQLRAHTGALILETKTEPKRLPTPLERLLSVILVTAALLVLSAAIILTGTGVEKQSRVAEETLAQPSPTSAVLSYRAQSPRRAPDVGKKPMEQATERPPARAVTGAIAASSPAASPSGTAQPLPSAPVKAAVPGAAKPAGSGAARLAPAHGQNLGLLVIKSQTRARIYINGQFSGFAPRTIKLLAGEHTVVLSADGYQDWSQKVQVRGGQQASILADLNKKR
jgi:hypothetical protein